ncbi:MAG: hypothetical protein CMP66_00595 [Flavobacteriales bacterium]|nr:hypothetical protein [Flavobacteriales bacterium]|tara:strand:+ start:12398 stop:13237 length:840 start_codon:yes stop_codon:yes gene_type:complete
MKNQEVSVRDILFGVVNFFRNQAKTIVLFLVLGVIVSVIYHNSKKPYFETSAIAISGLYFYENYEDQKILDPQLAIEIVNFLSEDVRNKNRKELSELLNLPTSIVANIKSIAAEGLYRIDADNRQNPISKFEIKLKVYDKEIVEEIEEGLLYYFTNNPYLKSYYEVYQERNETIIKRIDEEISSLKSARNSQTRNSDFSSISITNDRSESRLQNQIIELYKQKQDYIKEYALLKPLSFVKSFSSPEKPEDLLWVRIMTITLISFVLGFVIAGIKELGAK